MGLDVFLIRSRLNNDFKTPRLKRFDGRTRWAVVKRRVRRVECTTQVRNVTIFQNVFQNLDLSF